MKTTKDRSKSSTKSKTPFIASKSDSGFFNVQQKLQVGQPNDKYEVEADRIADRVVNEPQPKNQPFFSSIQQKIVQPKPNKLIQEKPLAETITPLVQRQEEEEEAQAKLLDSIIQKQEEEEEEAVQPKLLGLSIQKQGEEEEMLQMQEEEEAQPKLEIVQRQEEEEEFLMANTGIGKVEGNKSIDQKLKSTCGNGNPMNSKTKTQMESSFGVDFSGIKVHTDSTAIEMNKNMGAQAFTSGNDIYFNQGRFNPSTTKGKHLLAHELTHTIQQKGSVALNLQFTIGDNNDLQSVRFANNNVFEACLDGERTLRFGSRGRPVSIMQQALVDAGFPLPVHGVDGIFEDETRGTLQNFQRSSSVSATGVLDPATMSSLDALFSYGAPILPSGSAANVAPTVTSETIKFAPNGTTDTRTTIGVGERVRFTGNTAGDWTVSEGRVIGINNGENMVWEAPPTASSPTITLTTPGGAASLSMTVIAPNSLTMAVNSNPPIPTGTLGAYMLNDLVIHPLHVNFGRTQWFEVPGPATNVTGYWSAYSAAQLYHNPNPNYLPFDDNNSGLVDNVAWRGGNRPFAAGTHDWVIPNRYKIDGESDAHGRFFTNTTQSFYITSTGTIMITKAGALVIRTINNMVF